MSIYDLNLFKNIPPAPEPQTMGTPASQMVPQAAPQIQANPAADHEEPMTLKLCCRICFEEFSRAMERIRSDASHVGRWHENAARFHRDNIRTASLNLSDRFPDL